MLILMIHRDMHRYRSLFGSVLLLCALVTGVGSSQPRVDMNINDDWKFARENPSGAHLPSLSDEGWERISLPHTWNARDGQDGGNDYYRGTGWYRKRLVLDERYRAKSVFLKFDGASINATVYVNGVMAGGHKGSFSAFCFEVTDFVKFGDENLIAVKVSNAKDTAVAPLRGDFTMFGGLYRGVHVLVLEDLSISPLDFASPGVYIRQSSVTRERAYVEVTTVLRNATGTRRDVQLRTIVKDASGTVAATVESDVTIPAGRPSEELQSFEIANPHLWDGTRDPYLYEVSVEVFEKNTLRDRVIQPMGLRFFAVDAATGFSLNGRPMRLNGVNRHQDRENKGWAIGMQEHEEDYALITEIGATSVRLAHYQQAQEFYDLCDRGGMIVWAELGLVDEIHPCPEFAELCNLQLTELIKQSLNHPSIMFWSVFNELMPESNRPLYERVVRDLDALARKLDPTRFTVMASRSRYEASEPMNTVTDLVGYNVYRGWYEGKPEDFAAFADSLHARYPDTRFCISEYGAGASLAHHEIPPKKPPTKGPWHPEEWQSLLHEVTWKAMETRRYLWGTFVWNMFDFASDGRSEGDCLGRNDKGLVTFDRKIRKDAFYWYKANWNPEPMVHIASKRFVPRPAGPTEIRVYTNCDSLGVTLNGASLGVKVGTGKSVVWENVELPAGRNRVEATGYSQGRTITDVWTWDTIVEQAPEAMKGK